MRANSKVFFLCLIRNSTVCSQLPPPMWNVGGKSFSALIVGNTTLLCVKPETLRSSSAWNERADKSMKTSFLQLQTSSSSSTFVSSARDCCSLLVIHETTRTRTKSTLSRRKNKNEHSHNIHENCFWNFSARILLLFLLFKGNVTNDSQFFAIPPPSTWELCCVMEYERDSSENIKKKVLLLVSTCRCEILRRKIAIFFSCEFQMWVLNFFLLVVLLPNLTFRAGHESSRWEFSYVVLFMTISTVYVI